MHQGVLDANQLENSLTEKDIGVLLNTKLNMNQQCAFVAKRSAGILGCIRRKVLLAG